MELYFTEEEMVEFLEKREFFIEEIDAWTSRHDYHNRVVFEDMKVKIAYPDSWEFPNPKRPDSAIERGEHYELTSQYGVKLVFEKELHKALLNL